MAHDVSAEAELAPWLDPGERVLWAGRPETGLKLRPHDALMIPFSLMWGGFAFFWEAMALAMTFGVGFATRDAGAGAMMVLFPLWGIPFCVVGAYMIFGRFFADARIRARTLYGLTPSRVVIVSGLFSSQIRSIPLGQLGELTVTEGRGGRGTLTFGRQFSPWGRRRQAPPAFEFVEDVREVDRLVRQAVAALR
jgi:hypothetical protein